MDLVLKEGKICGYFSKDKPDSDFITAWDAALKDKEFV